MSLLERGCFAAAMATWCCMDQNQLSITVHQARCVEQYALLLSVYHFRLQILKNFRLVLKAFGQIRENVILMSAKHETTISRSIGGAVSRISNTAALTFRSMAPPDSVGMYLILKCCVWHLLLRWAILNALLSLQPMLGNVNEWGSEVWTSSYRAVQQTKLCWLCVCYWIVLHSSNLLCEILW